MGTGRLQKLEEIKTTSDDLYIMENKNIVNQPRHIIQKTEILPDTHNQYKEETQTNVAPFICNPRECGHIQTKNLKKIIDVVSKVNKLKHIQENEVKSNPKEKRVLYNPIHNKPNANER